MQAILDLIKTIFTFLGTEKCRNTALSTLAIAVSFYAVQATFSLRGDYERSVSEMPTIISDAVTVTPMKEIKYGLEGLASDEEIYAQIKTWHELQWGSQISALQTICQYDPSKLHEVMTAETQVNVCRLVN